MHNPEPQAPEAPVPLAERWRRLRAAYRYANLASHHVLGFTVKLALLVYFGLGILFLALRYAILPNIDLYKGDIERAASHALGNKVAIARIYATWSGVHPFAVPGRRHADGRRRTPGARAAFGRGHLFLVERVRGRAALRDARADPAPAGRAARA
jgi:hypothetical protein